MDSRWSTPFRDSRWILHSFILSLVILTALELPVLSIFFSQSFLAAYFPLLLMVWFPVRVMLSAAIMGSLIDLVIGEEDLVSWSMLRRNLGRQWRIYLAAQLVLLVLQFLCFLLISPTLFLFAAGFFQFPVWCGLSWWMLRSKYPGRPLRQTRLAFRLIWPLLVLQVLDIVLRVIAQGIGFQAWGVPQLLVFLVIYVELLAFVYLARIAVPALSGDAPAVRGEKELILVFPINSGSFVGFLGSLFLIWYPAVFAVLSALTPRDYKIRRFSGRLWSRRYYQPNRLVAITCFTSNSFAAYKIAREFRRLGSKVVMGGPHVSFVPEEALEYCDSVVVGEAEGVWRQVVRDYERQDLKKIYHGRATEQDHQAVHDWLLSAPPQLLRNCLETTRGCKFDCSFCCIPALSCGVVRKKPVAEVVALVQRLRDAGLSISLTDNNIYSDPAYARELFLALKPLRVKWAASCSIDIAANEPMLQLAKESGCAMLLIGFEISSESLEKSQGGKFRLADRYLELSRRIRAAGIGIKAHFIFGFDSDSVASFFALWRLCQAISPSTASLSILTPFPGTRVYQQKLLAGDLMNIHWTKYSIFHPVMNSGRLSYGQMRVVAPPLVCFFLLTSSWLGRMLLMILIAVIVSLILYVGRSFGAVV